ncbi:hydantoinase B/oxoprolinase family protein [Candidatus Bipolaricaulota bacterium]|nr:hydantoinase B/oxoprolinase family protein [Candidatus Bipolaricaulota bacterium]
MTKHCIDPFTVEVIKRALISAAEQMFVAFGRTSKSSVIYEVLDYGCAVTDANARMIAQANGIPPFIGVLSDAVQEILDKFGLEGLDEEDVIILNDPYMGGATHQNDVVLVMPVFYQGKPIMFAASKGHWNDVGGKDPGSWSPNATEIYQEGLQFPAVKLFERGKEVQGIVDILTRNIRIPEMILGDMRAQAASLQVAASRITQICDKYGLDTVLESIEIYLEQGRQEALEELKSLPKGEFTAEEYIDDDGLGGDPVLVKVKVTITDDEFIVDYTGTGKTCRGPINAPLSALISTAKFAYKAVVSPHGSSNEGLFAPLKVIVPEDTVFNPKRPAPISTYWESDSYAGDVIWKALADAIPTRITAGHFLSVCGTTVSGIDDRSGEWFFSVEPNAGGWGAGLGKDGESGLVCSGDGETYVLSIEVAETRYPFVVDQFALNMVDGGHGKWRGGYGLVKDYRITNSGAYVTASFGRNKFPPWGLAGGMGGTPNSVEIRATDGEIERRGRFSKEELHAGDVARFITGMGGGYGDPRERDPQAVFDDVLDGYITEKIAEDVYGVVVLGDPLRIDLAATKALRKE